MCPLLLSGLLFLASLGTCRRRGRLGIKGFALPVGRGHGGGRFEVYFPILDRVYQTPAIGSDTRVEAHVDVGLADVASEDERGAGLLGAGVALAQYVQQHTCR